MCRPFAQTHPTAARPPASDPEPMERSVARPITQVFCWSVLSECLIGAIACRLFAPHDPDRILICVAAAVCATFCLGLLRLGRVRFAAGAILWLLWSVTAIGAFRNGGIESVALTAGIVFAAFAGLVFGIRHALGLCAASAVLLTVLLISGRHANLGAPTPPALRAVAYVLFSVMIAILLWRTAALLNDSARAARDEAARRACTEVELHDSEQRFRHLVENAPDVLFRYRFEPTPGYDYISPAVERFGGFRPEEFYADHLLAGKIAHPEDRPLVQRILADREAPAGTQVIRWLTREGRTLVTQQRFVAIRGSDGRVVALEGIARDVTESIRETERRRALEAQLSQAQKMECIGVLAGGIAHDFNNILTGILGFTEIARVRPDDASLVAESLDQIRQAGLRAKDLVAQILTFARQGQPEHVTLELHRAVGEAVKFLRAATPATIRIESQLAAGRVRADPTQVYQVVLNLATNALHAMGQGPGTLTFRLEPCSVSNASPSALAQAAPGAYLRLTVADTGHGMDERTLARIFDPLFTTKPTGVGTGLGLSVVQSIVRAHRGAVTVESEPGRGATFRVYWPACDSQTEPSPASEPAAPASGERILLVDDEVSVGQFAAVRLRQLRYRVEVFQDPALALKRFRAAPLEFDAVVSDSSMPGMNGWDFVALARGVHPDLPAVVMTAGGLEPPVPAAAAGSPIAVVSKPFTGDDLARVLAGILCHPCLP